MRNSVHAQDNAFIQTVVSVFAELDDTILDELISDSDLHGSNLISYKYTL